MGLRADLEPRTDPFSRALAVVAVMLSVLFVAWLLLTATAGPPATIQTVTVVNETGLSVAVDAVGAGGETLTFGVVAPSGPTARHDVADLGDTWEFVATYGGAEVARTPKLTRRQLAADGWTVRIAPTDRTRELQRAGFR